MFNLNNISKSIAKMIAMQSPNINKDNEEVIAYGIYAIFQIGLSILFVIIFGIIFNVLIEALIMSFSISILRKYSGGVHSNSSFGCLFIGTFICIVIPSLINRLYITFGVTLSLGIIIFLFSYVITYRLAPVDSINKPIKKISKRKKLKKRSIQILTIYFIIVSSLVFIYYFNNSRDLLLYCNALYAGILWQVFSLTNLGHKLLGGLDVFLNKIFLFIN